MKPSTFKGMWMRHATGRGHPFRLGSIRKMALIIFSSVADVMRQVIREEDKTS